MEMLSTLNEASVESLDSLKESTNKQKNQAVLDNLGENADGQLTYKGEAIGTPNLHMEEVKLDYDEGHIHMNDSNIMTIECVSLPLNARVRRVEIPDVVSGTDEYIALEDMVSKDPERLPYYIMYPKNMEGDTESTQGIIMKVVARAVFTRTTNNFCSAIQGWLFFGKTIKIYYEIEE